MSDRVDLDAALVHLKLEHPPGLCGHSHDLRAIVAELGVAREVIKAVLDDTDNREPSESTLRIELALDAYDQLEHEQAGSGGG